MPLDLLFNAVPHPAWVRSFMYEQVTSAVRLAVNDETIPNRSRMQVKVSIYVCIYICVQIYVYIYTNIHLYIYIYM
jgi:hypothetical protein